jgi:hypothetical protein
VDIEFSMGSCVNVQNVVLVDGPGNSMVYDALAP